LQRQLPPASPQRIFGYHVVIETSSLSLPPFFMPFTDLPFAAPRILRTTNLHLEER